MATMDTIPMPQPDALPQIRRIGSADINWALAEGWKDFQAKRGDLIVVGLLYPLICLVAVVLTLNEPLLPLLFPLVAGLSLAGPAAASGFYELARRREAGLESSWWHFLDPLKGRSRTPLVLLTAGLGALFIAWLIVAYLIYTVTFGVRGPMQVGDVFGSLFTTSAGIELIVLGNLAGLGFAVVALLYAAVSFPMVVDKPVDAGFALRTSIKAVTSNWVTMLGWGLRIVLLLALGLLPAAIGLAVVLPWLGYSTWHLYTRLVAR